MVRYGGKCIPYGVNNTGVRGYSTHLARGQVASGPLHPSPLTFKEILECTANREPLQASLVCSSRWAGEVQVQGVMMDDGWGIFKAASL